MIVRCFTGTGGQRNFRKSLAPRATHTMADLQQWLGQVSPEEPVVVVAHRLLSERLRAVAELLPAAVYDAHLDIDNANRHLLTSWFNILLTASIKKIHNNSRINE